MSSEVVVASSANQNLYITFFDSDYKIFCSMWWHHIYARWYHLSSFWSIIWSISKFQRLL